MDSPYHFPPEFLSLLVDTIPRLVKGKEQVIDFFAGAGVDERFLGDLRIQLRADSKSLNKFKIARIVLLRLNELGDDGVLARRQVIRRVEEWEDFSGSYESDRLEAEGLVAKVRHVRNVKDSFIRISMELERAKEKNRSAYEAEAESKRKRLADLGKIRDRLAASYGAQDPQGRGKRLEGILNDLFRLLGISVSESFHVIGTHGEGIVEQIDGAIRLRERVQLVEMKWWRKPLGYEDVATLAQKVFVRPDCGGILIAEPSVTAPVMEHFHDIMLAAKTTLIVVDLREVYEALDPGGDVTGLLLSRLDRAVLHKKAR